MSPEGSKPRLVAVDGQPTGGTGEPAAAPPDPDRRYGVWLFAGLLLLALIALGVQTSRVEALQQRVAGLGAELAQARATVGAYRRHLDDVRGSVAELQARVGDLSELLERDPAASPAPGEPTPPRD